MSLVEVRARTFNRLDLVVAIRAAAGDLLVYGNGREECRVAAAIHDALQLVTRENAAYLAHGRVLVVYEERVEAVRQEDERSVAELLLQAIRV